MKTEVSLSFDDAKFCCWKGCLRQLNAMSKKLRDNHGLKPDTVNGWSEHIEGFAGELAVAIALGLPRPDVEREAFRTAHDVGGLVDVRTRSKHWYDLPLYEKDPHDRIFILVTGRIPNFRLRGWILARDGKREEFYKKLNNDRPPGWFVPASNLRPMSELVL